MRVDPDFLCGEAHDEPSPYHSNFLTKRNKSINSSHECKEISAELLSGTNVEETNMLQLSLRNDEIHDVFGTNMDLYNCHT